MTLPLLFSVSPNSSPSHSESNLRFLTIAYRVLCALNSISSLDLSFSTFTLPDSAQTYVTSFLLLNIPGKPLLLSLLIPSAWNALPQDFLMDHSFIVSRSLFICYFFSEAFQDQTIHTSTNPLHAHMHKHIPTLLDSFSALFFLYSPYHQLIIILLINFTYFVFSLLNTSSRNVSVWFAVISPKHFLAQSWHLTKTC